MTASTVAINVAKKKLGLDEETYRAKLTNITGKSSLRAMTEAERQKVLTVFRSEGFQPGPNTARRADGRQKLTGKFAKKLQALWIGAWNLGIVDNRDDAALLAFVKRQTGLDHTRFLHHADDARAAIEALKAWMRREAGVDWRSDRLAPDYARHDGYRIAWAQWAKLSSCPDDFWTVATDLIHRHVGYRSFTDSEWIQVMNILGRRIRSAETAR